MNNKVLNNVEYILKQFKDYIKNDKQLVLLYWMHIDKVEMDRKTISTQDFLNKATSPEMIVNAKEMLGLMHN